MTSVWRRGSDSAAVGDADRTVLLRLDDTSGSEPRILEGTAAAVWSLIDGVRSSDEILEVLAERYSMPVRTIRSDVLQFLDHLAAAGFIEPVEVEVEAGAGEAAG